MDISKNLKYLKNCRKENVRLYKELDHIEFLIASCTIVNTTTYNETYQGLIFRKRVTLQQIAFNKYRINRKNNELDILSKV